jgi:hypothetical protein
MRQKSGPEKQPAEDAIGQAYDTDSLRRRISKGTSERPFPPPPLDSLRPFVPARVCIWSV